jgi:membrane protein involved in colicin uptake
MGTNTQTTAATKAAEEKAAKAAEEKAAKAAEEKAAKAAEEKAAKAAEEKAAAAKPPANAARAQELFARFPAAAELYFTGDGFAFLVKSDAVNHARSLKENEVVTIKRTA